MKRLHARSGLWPFGGWQASRQYPVRAVKRGMVLRLNKKTASVRTDEGQNWNVSAGLLSKAASS